MKLFLDEPESPAVTEIWETASSASSTHLTLVETRSALARAIRSRRLSPLRGSRAKAEADGFLSELHLIPVEPPLLARAAEVAETHALRGYDAVHLASALSLGDPEIVFVTWDVELRRAARAERLLVAA